jgi:hypothetical protein
MNIIYKMGYSTNWESCVYPKEENQLMREAHTSQIARHFGVRKTIANLQRYVYWPKMQEQISKFIKGCVFCSTSKPNNRKLGLSMPLPVPSRPWESISMYFVGGANVKERP